MTQPQPASRPEDDLAFIRRLMEGAHQTATDNSPQLVVWGCVLALAEILAHLRRVGELSISANITWAVAVAIGFAISVSLKHRARARAPVNSLVDRILGAIWLACAISLILLGFLVGNTGSLPPDAAQGVKALVIGSAFFASAFLPGRGTYRLLALAWWILGGALLIRPFPESGLVMAAALVLLMALPGLLMRTRQKPPAQLHLIA